jgi:hypothetical protein
MRVAEKLDWIGLRLLYKCRIFRLFTWGSFLLRCKNCVMFSMLLKAWPYYEICWKNLELELLLFLKAITCSLNLFIILLPVWPTYALPYSGPVSSNSKVCICLPFLPTLKWPLGSKHVVNLKPNKLIFVSGWIQWDSFNYKCTRLFRNAGQYLPVDNM